MLKRLGKSDREALKAVAKECGVTGLGRASDAIASTLFEDLQDHGSWDDLLGAVGRFHPHSAQRRPPSLVSI